MVRKCRCFQSLIVPVGKLPSWKSPTINTAGGAELSPSPVYSTPGTPGCQICQQLQALCCKMAEMQKTGSPHVSLLPTSTKQKACRLRFCCIKRVYRILYRNPYTDSSSRDLFFFLNLKIWAMFPKSERFCSPLPRVCTVIRHLHFYGTASSFVKSLLIHLGWMVIKTADIYRIIHMLCFNALWQVHRICITGVWMDSVQNK